MRNASKYPIDVSNLANKKPSILIPFVFIFFVFHAFMRLSRYLRLLSLSGLNL